MHDLYMCVSLCVCACIHSSCNFHRPWQPWAPLLCRWTDGDASPKALVISIHDDNTFEPTEADEKPTEAESEALLEWWPAKLGKNVGWAKQDWKCLKPKIFRISFFEVSSQDGQMTLMHRTLCHGNHGSHGRVTRAGLHRGHTLVQSKFLWMSMASQSSRSTWWLKVI